MEYDIRTLGSAEFPSLLKEIPDPPEHLFCAGLLPSQNEVLLCVVGSRKHTVYGKEVCEELVSELRGLPVSIVSGLALGIDSIAHKTALKNKIHTIAVPGSGLSPKVLYPQSHLRLAEEIIEAGGALLSEFENDFRATPWSFPQRNRIMAGMSKATLVIEAEEKSGTLITSRLATEYNRDVLTIPGSIFSSQSDGPNMLIRLGATPIRNSKDLKEALGFKVENGERAEYEAENDEEKAILDILNEPKERSELIRLSKLPTHIANSALAMLEIKGVIVESMGEIRKN